MRLSTYSILLLAASAGALSQSFANVPSPAALAAGQPRTEQQPTLSHDTEGSLIKGDNERAPHVPQTTIKIPDHADLTLSVSLESLVLSQGSDEDPLLVTFADNIEPSVTVLDIDIANLNVEPPEKTNGSVIEAGSQTHSGWSDAEGGEPIAVFLFPTVILSICGYGFVTLALLSRRGRQYSKVVDGKKVPSKDLTFFMAFTFPFISCMVQEMATSLAYGALINRGPHSIAWHILGDLLFFVTAPLVMGAYMVASKYEDVWASPGEDGSPETASRSPGASC